MKTSRPCGCCGAILVEGDLVSDADYKYLGEKGNLSYSQSRYDLPTPHLGITIVTGEYEPMVSQTRTQTDVVETRNGKLTIVNLV
jgi:hypothetical protein